MKKLLTILILSSLCGGVRAAEADALTLSLDQAIGIARQNSPAAQSSRNSFSPPTGTTDITAPTICHP